MTEPRIIHSNLAKAAQLALSSAQFRPMVHAACIQLGVPYDERILQLSAINPVVLDTLELVEGSTMDVAILNKVSTVEGSLELDQAIINSIGKQ